MTRILVTGGNGGLGRELVPRLTRAGYAVRILSRQARPPNLAAGLEWSQADLADGTGLAPAIAGVDCIVHAATSPAKFTEAVDVAGTRRLLESARPAGLRHFVHVSIVGIDRLPYAYYRAKLAGEAAVCAGGIPFTIQRATQFHSLIDGLFLAPYRNLPIGLMPADFKFQPIETGEVADRLVELVPRPPAGFAPDMGGPQVLTLAEMAGDWLAARRRRCWMIPIFIPGRLAQALRRGYNTCPEHRDGKLTWGEWVRQKYST